MLDDQLLSGAQALARVLHEHGTQVAFAYPGTSELALCAALHAAGISVVNSRGDKEAVFMAAGHNSIKPRTAAVLHGARGLTNALGAVADVRRSERHVLCLTGLAARTSSPYLPRHAEPDLITGAGCFACAAIDASTLTGWNAGEYIDLMRAALAPAPGPVLLGVPHDVAVTSFVPAQVLETAWSTASTPVQLPDLQPAAAMIGRARR